MVIAPLRIKVYQTDNRWVAEGINCEMRLSFVSKDRLYEAIRLKAEHVREDPGIRAAANAA